MLCPSCRRQLDRGAGFCLGCGMPVDGHEAPLELVLGDRTRVPVVGDMTIGRAPGSTIVLEPANPSERSIEIKPSDDFAVLGVVCGVFRPFQEEEEPAREID